MKKHSITLNGITMVVSGEHHEKDLNAGITESYFEPTHLELQNPLDLIESGITLDQIRKEVENNTQ